MSRNWKTIHSEHEHVVSQMAEMGTTLDRIADAIISGLRSGKRVFVFGNGGSAADAQHIAAELLGRYRLERRALPVIALAADSSTITAIGNDLGFEQVFARQLEGLLTPDDVVWALSTSGTSPNVLEGLRAAAERGAITVGFTGQEGGALAELCTHVLIAPHSAPDRIQEAHVLAYHYICERVEATLAG